MVVTVIAILALLILPLFQRQTEEARITAAEADIRSFAVAMQLANAHTEKYFTLSSLDNTDNFDAVTIDATLDVPVVTWNDALTAVERADLADSWAGPYTSFRNDITAAELEAFFPGTFFRGSATGATTPGDNGPINQQYDTGIGGANFSADRIPVDPWGNPYLFYGPDYYHLPSGAGGLVTETRYRNSLFVSFGPNGVPGDLTTFSPGDAATLMRESGIIGTGDDIFRIM